MVSLPAVIPFGGGNDGQPGDVTPRSAPWPVSAAHFVCDEDGRVLAWNHGAERLLGLPSAEAIGQRLDQLFPGESIDSLLEAQEAVGEFSPAQAWSPHDALGVVRTVLRSVLVVPGSDGKRIVLCGVWPAQHPLSPASPRGNASVDHVGTLAARIAHDFNGLLAPVIGNVILLEEETPGGHHVRQRVIGIREATEAARGFAQRLMALDPRRKPTLEAADLGRVVRDCLPAVRAAVRAEIVIEEAGGACVDSVRVNPKQIEHAIVQLALNAQDAMPSGGKIVLSLDAMESKGGAGQVPAGRWVRLRVRDNGRGMEPSMLI